MINIIRILIYKYFPSWTYYQIAYLIKKRRLKISNKYFINKNYSIPIFNVLNKNKIYKNVFIFGSGSSINELTKQNYKEINNSLSIGINKWVFHDFVTNYYMIELTSNDYLNERFRLRIHTLLKNKIKNPIFLIHQGKCNPKKMKNWTRGMNLNRVILYEYLRPDIFKKNIKYQFLKTLKFLYIKNKKTNILTLGIGATLERAICLSILLKYSKIIILGVDLKNTKVFWNSDDKNFKGINNDQKYYGPQYYGPHKTAIPERFGGTPVQKSILILDSLARETFNSKILITTNNSLLSEKLEKYKWNNYSEMF